MFKKLILGSSLASYLLFANPQKEDCCGIAAILSKRKVPTQVQPEKQQNKKITVESYLCHSVQLMKNRGYDSAGIATFSWPNEQLQHNMIKYADEGNHEINCIQRVVQEVSSKLINSTIGIAHTRWATCGIRADRNSHPHSNQEQNIFVVHNGILGNHQQIKGQHLTDTTFKSQTDTEVIAQMLGKLRKQGLTMVESMRKFEEIASEKSQWGLVVIDKSTPDVLYTFTSEAPILIAFSKEEDEIYVASEMIAFQKQANCFFESKDSEIFALKISDIPEIKKKMEKENRLRVIDNSVEVLIRAPQPFKTFYSYEIRQQALIKFKPAFDRIKVLNFGKYLSMIGCGSSYLAACCSESFFKKLKCFKKIHITDPVELEEGDIVDDETVVLISQSGETKDLINIIYDCQQKKNVKTIGIVNVEGSTIARKVDFPIYIKVGREVSVGATKSFFHQIINLVQFATEVAQKKKSSPPELIQEIRNELLNITEYAQQTIDLCEQKCKELAEIIYKRQSIYLLAKKEGVFIAKEAALKIKQLTYIHAEAFGACEMKHGPIALIDSESKTRETVVILFIYDNQSYEVMMNALDQMHSRNAYVVVVTNCEEKIDKSYNEQLQKNPDAVKKYHFLLSVPHLNHMSHLLSIIPMQILVERIGELKGINPDAPRNLAKTVTV